MLERAIDTRPISDLRPHPENATIFGDPEESDQFEGILASIRQHGIWEPLVIRPDGTILSGHLRFAVARKLKLKTVPVRVVTEFTTYRDEVTFIIRSNTDRRQLTKGEIAIAFKRLRELPKEEGGTKRAMGRPKRGEEKSATKRGHSGDPSAEDAASVLGVSRDEARSLETVFATPGVPASLKKAVNTGVIAPTPAAKAVRAEQRRQGGEIKDGSALRVFADKPNPRLETKHEDRVAQNAEAYDRDYRELFTLYKKLDDVLTRRPLKSVLGPTEHHQYFGMIRDVSMRAWREIESVQGPTNTGRQMSLTVVPGGKS